MKGLIFAAGLGTRLKPLTDNLPKALVNLAGRPMLQHVIEKLIGAGIDDIIINVHHHSDKIDDFIKRNNCFGVNITLSRERDYPLETGGGLLKVADLLDGDNPVVLHNADIFTDFPLTEMIDSHLTSGADVTLLADTRSSSRQLLFNDFDRLVGWVNKTTGEVKPSGVNPEMYNEKAFGGVHIINPRPLLAQLKSWAVKDVFSIIPAYLALVDNIVIKSFTPQSPYGWHDIGTIEKLQAAEAYLSSKNLLNVNALS